MKLSQLQNKKILILGFAREGITTLNYLSKHFPDQEFSLSDQSSLDKLSDEAKQILTTSNQIDQTYFGENYLDAIAQYDLIIKTPGIPANLAPLQQFLSQGKTITSATAIFFANSPHKIIGITGTKGKSTTTSLIYEVLKAGGLDVNLVGNIGIPALDQLDDASKDQIFIFELSSYQLSDLTLSPNIAVFTSIYPEHLNYHQTFENYFKAKQNITKFQTPSDYFIYNSDYPEIENLSQKTKALAIGYSKDKKADQPVYLKKDILYYQNQQIISTKELHLKGEINYINCMPAIIIAKLFDIKTNKIHQALKSFQPLPHRLELVTTKHGIKFFNDSLATIPEATIAAINTLGSNVQTLIAGGFDRGLDFSLLGKFLSQSQTLKNLILFPTTGEKIWAELIKYNKDTKIQKFDVTSMEEAINLAFKNTDKGKICLLSPASTSFNMFKDYKDRGDKFKQLIKEY